ncbi:hypothetical protein GALMADRAFT_1268043 [Galerina marginata CBS 339.88]|uniref:Nephrocystin 3-like N-terminal domain-containing protein n=1 Tax=Galerina marginata (strain CBS 339.88) TaxID=685588 RepID=A0A067T6D2_GALM3|nr:hypothetical protein GALMADRAFT_1268043 [Galerina marginata CBS 339.88]
MWLSPGERTSTSPMFRLEKNIAVGALHDSGERFNPPRCHPETRGVLLAEIMDWVTKSNKDSLVLWIYGPVGSGKSALAQSIAEQSQARGLLAASFFFSRMSKERSHEKHFAATIAYQLALSLPGVRTLIEDAIRQDPSIFGRALQTQFQKLIARPLRYLAVKDGTQGLPFPQLIVIDALDECHDPKVQRYILNIINEEFQRHPNPSLLFVITSRPEEHLRMSFCAGNIAPMISRVSLEDYFGSYDDIRVFLLNKFNEIRQEHPLNAFIPQTWPPQEVIKNLVRKSSGQFVYAATVIEYVSSIQHRPTDRLDIILGLAPPDGELPFSELDALYKHVFSSITNIPAALHILSAVLLMDLKLSPEMVENFLFLKPGDVQLYLTGLASVIDFHDRQKEIKVLHASLSDFLLDATRSEKLYIEAGSAHSVLAKYCLRHLDIFEVPFLIDYSCYNFESHFDLASPSQELHDELLKFQIVSLHKNSKSPALQSTTTEPTLTLEDLWYFTPAFFDCIENSVIFKDAQNICDHHLRLFDGYLEAEFDKYCGDDRLTDLVTMLTVYHSPITVPNLDDVPLCQDALFEFNGPAEHLVLIDEFSLNLRHMVRRHAQSEPYIELLCEFLEDPGRAGRHFIEGDRYARAALRCARQISKPLPHNNDDHGLKAFMWSLECTPPLLLRGAYNEELVLFLKDASLGAAPSQPRHSYYPIFARMVRESRLAYLISSYLRVEDKNSYDHVAQLDIVPQGLRVSLHAGKKPAPRVNFTDYLVNDAANVVGKACCTSCLIAEYYNPYGKGNQNTDLSFNPPNAFIIHVEDPFPEIDYQSIHSSDPQLSATVSGVIQILAYRIWKRLLQNTANSS